MANEMYSRRSRWKLILFIIANIIIGATLFYTNNLASRLAEEELRKVNQIADVYRYLATTDNIEDFGFFLDLIQANKTVPVISTDEDGNILAYQNIDSARIATHPDYLQQQLEEMKNFAQPIRFDITESSHQYIYYQHSKLYAQLRLYPIVQLVIFAAFLFTAYIFFNTSRRSEQNRVWVGMAKETAHQLGTPISSMVAWIEYLKEHTSPDDSRQNVVEEMDKDVKRLELIADRFSKVGSAPDLMERDLNSELRATLEYISRRASKKVQFHMQEDVSPLIARVNPTLFNWVVENLLKNALDAMEGAGEISIHTNLTDKDIIVDITDTGKGIPKNKQRTVFEPGYSTKKRGWGLGLTLAKRIIESYHNGRIFVKQSNAKGTTFRITLPLG
ncbi:MAG TPA: HAMP domain-containing sensor histidine kinase [Chitinophagales bacterium]|nr:HAMP domain-containing sensor histidine kinase [Chitinophagales bacterium]